MLEDETVPGPCYCIPYHMDMVFHAILYHATGYGGVGLCGGHADCGACTV